MRRALAAQKHFWPEGVLCPFRCSAGYSSPVTVCVIVCSSCGSITSAVVKAVCGSCCSTCVMSLTTGTPFTCERGVVSSSWVCGTSRSISS